MTCRLFPLLSLFAACCQLPALVVQPSLTIGSWNLQNFLVGNRFEDGRFLFAYPMPEIRKARIRELILLYHPDLLFLQEVGGPAFLVELQRDLAAAGLVYPYYHFSGFADSRSGLAFLSKMPPAEVVFHDLSLRRGIQELRIRLEDSCLRVFHVHLKSRFSDDPADPHSTRIRQQEIAALSSALKRFLANDSRSRILLLGDFNTPFDDALLSPLHQNWDPLLLADSSGNPDTYFHHSGTSEILDGCWVPTDSPLRPAGALVPLPDNCPSDHRFLVLRLPPTP